MDALLTAGRGYNSRALVGIQSIAQLTNTYGSDGADDLVGGFGQYVCMQSGADEATADFEVEAVGAETVERSVATVDSGGRPDGAVQEQSRVYPVTRSDFRNFRTGEAVVVDRDGGWVRGQTAELVGPGEEPSNADGFWVRSKVLGAVGRFF